MNAIGRPERATPERVNFSQPIPEALLNITAKTRSNVFAWRGQFSPQLIESLLAAYCPPDSVVLDPFAGSGTVLQEAATASLPAFGFEINPSAWSFSKLCEFANLFAKEREVSIAELRDGIQREFPLVIFSYEDELRMEEFEEKVIRIGESLSDQAKVICNALVVLLDLYNNQISNDLVQHTFRALAALIRQLPYSDRPIKVGLQDARALPLQNQSIDFVITSPPYINVFNYHQNYRRSVELLGWDLLRVARSEIGSNRANRGNRFYTVTQYCIDIGKVLQELARVLRPDGRAIVVIGRESNVLGTPFFNADLIAQLACTSEMFSLVLRQQRVFTNRYGKPIREDILNLQRKDYRAEDHTPLGREVARAALSSAAQRVPEKSRHLLVDAISRVDQIAGTPIFNSSHYAQYQTRDSVMMVKERDKTI